MSPARLSRLKIPQGIVLELFHSRIAWRSANKGSCRFLVASVNYLSICT
jgi:hypothetical protein